MYSRGKNNNKSHIEFSIILKPTADKDVQKKQAPPQKQQTRKQAKLWANSYMNIVGKAYIMY